MKLREPTGPKKRQRASPTARSKLRRLEHAPPEAKRIQELEAQVKEKEQKYVYLYADFENYKKRMVKERSDLMKFGWEAGARELLEVIDNLERALAHMPKTGDAAHKTLEDGIKMVLNQFRAVLEKQGVHHDSGGRSSV